MYSIINLMKKNGWIWDDTDTQDFIPFIQDAGGVVRAIESLPATIKSHTRIGIIVDADMNPESRWEQIKAKCSEYFPDFPETPEKKGTVLRSGDKHLGIWIMPNNVDAGKLEDFLATLVPKSDQCWNWAEHATKEAANRDAQFTQGDFIKAHIHTWLAWRSNPGMPFGTAITSATLTHDSALALEFVKWMVSLFVD